MTKLKIVNVLKFVEPVGAPLLLLGFVLVMWEPIAHYYQGEERYHQEVLREWVREARVYRSLPELTREYLDLTGKLKSEIEAALDDAARQRRQKEAVERLRYLVKVHNALELQSNKRLEILTHLKSLGEPVTMMYKGQLPLFPAVYRLELSFDDDLRAQYAAFTERLRRLGKVDPSIERAFDLEPLVWDSQLPRHEGQYRSLPQKLEIYPNAYVDVHYHLRVYAVRQAKAREEAARRQYVFGLLTILAAVAALVLYIAWRRAWRRQRQQLEAQQKINEAERRRLEEALKRQEAERQREEIERANLELKSQLWANIGIMAGSYAHNIKNLLVRPNDLLNRCLEGDGLSPQQNDMLREVRHTLGTVTERLQQLLQTVRRDPSQARMVRVDLNEFLREMQRNWLEMAREKWKLSLELDLAPEPLWIEADVSHLQQAVENLLFNARDATFEMRHHLREQARSLPAEGEPGGRDASPSRRQALIAAASWRGEVVLRTRPEDGWVVLEVQDNGIGMTEEVRRRCTETHFSTKRNNALFAGLSAGMGLGLSFIAVILEHHRADMTIASEPQRGTTFRIRFPAARSAGQPAAAGRSEV